MNDMIFWEELRRKAVNELIPIQGHFELTSKCNFNCKMCYVHLDNTFKSGYELSLNDWIGIIDDAIEHGMIFASLTGGECLLSPYFKDIYLHLQSKGILINVLTNGFFLEEMLDFFVENPPRLIQVSVYGNNEDEYENVTGIRAYKRVSNTLNKAIQLKLPIYIAITPNKYLTNVIPIIKKYHSMGVPGGVAEYLLKPRSNTGRDNEDCSLTIDEAVQITKELNHLNLSDVELNQKADRYSISEIKSIPTLPRHNAQGILCVAGRCDFTIDWEGNMTMCSSLDSPKINVLEHGFSKAWSLINAAAASFNMPIECITCEYYSVCTHCPAFHLAGAEQGHCSPAICELAHELVKRGMVKI